MRKNSNHEATDGRSLVPEERRLQIAELVRNAGSIAVATLEREFGISPMTARRDLVALEEDGVLQRTHGGAVLPVAAKHEDSFWHRLEERVEAKERLAEAAMELLEPEAAVFLDCSTTSYHLARKILKDGPRVTLLTNCIPVMELFARDKSPKIELIGVGGFARKLALSFVGPHAIATVSTHYADLAFFSIKGITPEGHLTDPDLMEAELKCSMIEHAEKPILLADGSKFDQRGLSIVTHISKISQAVVTEAQQERLEPLTAAGVRVRQV